MAKAADFEMAIDSVPVNVIQGQLGHANLAVTDRYLHHVLPVDLVAAMRRRAWEL